MSSALLSTYRFDQLSPQQKKQLLLRPKMDVQQIAEIVQPIIERVQTEGDPALRHFTHTFDKADLQEVVFAPSTQEASLSDEVREAIDVAYTNIYAFHKAQIVPELSVETMPGVLCRRKSVAIERVGIYVPGGTAILPSTALMLGVPAQIAGCKTIVLATPPRPDGSIAPEVLYAAQKCGVTHILLAGGAQAIAAMAYGTQSVPKVDKLFGPGNQYVTAAKMALQNSDAMVAIDMPAGPSEVLVIADKHANPAFVAADLLSQAEHGIDSQVVLLATQEFNLKQLQEELQAQCNALPRAEIAKKALKNSFAISFDTTTEAMHFSNEYAPEHLIIQTENPTSLAEEVINAGSVFIGNWTPESVGDYASGTNHTLPTYGYARMYSGVNLAAYQKQITMQELTQKGIQNIGPTVEILATQEGLDAHAHAVRLRLQSLSNPS
jgi:histidinol dehydrogenase